MRTFFKKKWGLIIGHPGHELRVLGWMNMIHPVTIVLTDGSGSVGQSRLELTRSLMDQPDLSALMTDLRLYQAILNSESDVVIELAHQLAEWIIKYRIEALMGDGIDGYNPTHDLCRLLIDRAVVLAEQKLPYRIQNYAFLVTGLPNPAPIFEPHFCVDLDEEQWMNKKRSAIHYAGCCGGTLAQEVKSLFQTYPDNVFHKEYFYKCDSKQLLLGFKHHRPYYESYGEKQVSSGIYPQVIRFKQHFLSLVETLLECHL